MAFIKLFDIRENKQIWKIKSKNKITTSIIKLNNSQYAVAFINGIIEIRSLINGKLIKSITTGHLATKNSLMKNNKNNLIFVSSDRTVLTFNKF